MKLVVSYEIPERLQDRAEQADRDGDDSWLLEIADESRVLTVALEKGES
jgi:hypothetical protein